MLEGLRNYRSIAPAGNNPQSTMVLGGGSPSATLVSANSGGRGFAGEDQSVAATARSLNARASVPGQTPIVRRTGTIAPVPARAKKKSVVGTILAALLLLGVIVYGANKIKPVFEAARELRDEQKKRGNPPAAVPAGEHSSSNPADSPAGTEDSAQPRDPPAGHGAEYKPSDPKPTDIYAQNDAPQERRNTI